MANILGNDYEIIEEGLSGRTTNVDDPTDPRLNGSAYLPAALASHLPLDLVTIMLGTNDTKTYLNRTPLDIANGIGCLISQVAQSAGGVGTAYPAPKILLICPPPLADMPIPWFQEIFRGSAEKTRGLPKVYAALAKITGANFLDAGEFMTTDGIDGVHFNDENNTVLGTAVAERIVELFSTSDADSTIEETPAS